MNYDPDLIFNCSSITIDMLEDWLNNLATVNISKIQRVSSDEVINSIVM